MRKGIFTAFVCLCMMVALVPSMAYADDTVYTGGLCEHHTKHDDACGYTEGTAEVPCSHEHTEACYKLVTNCVHKHTEECYRESSTESDLCSYVCSEESGCITKELNCNHEHDKACGYVPATEGMSCTFVCEVCNAQGSGNAEASYDAQPKGCTCKTLCTDEEINMDCSVCSAEGVDLSTCKGMTSMLLMTGNSKISAANKIIQLRSVHTHPVCGSSENCTNPNHETGHADVTWTEWNKTASLPDSGGNYCLTENVTLSETWEVPNGETSLCLNGHSITFTNGLTNWDMSGKDIDYTSRSVIKVPNGAKLTITDCQNNVGTITGGTGTFVKGLYGNNNHGGYCGGGIFVDNGGTLNLYGGSIKENHCPMYKDASSDQGGGGGIFVNGGAFNMYGGIITQNSANQNGNGVFCWGGAFNMYGGSITENGREIPDWRLTYMGSTGGVGILNGADMTMYGGEISANLAYSLGGISVDGAGSSLTLYDDAKIINHTCQKLNFGGVYILSGAEFNMNGGQICDNTEGAVQVQDSTMVMTDGIISANQTYGTYGINISDYSEGSNVTISGGTVSGNSSEYKSDITHTNAENSSLILSGNPSIESISLEPKNVITIAGELTYDTPITVQKDGGGIFTSGWTEKMQGKEPENYFASWSKDYSLSLSEDELNLGTGDTEHIHNGITFDKDLGVDADDYYMSFPGITENGNYRLATDLAFGSENNLYNSLFIANDTSLVTVNLCLNKYNLNRMYGGLSTGPVLVVYTNGTLNLYSDEGGTISGNSSAKDDLTDGLGGGIYIEGGILNIYGGKITGNTADVAGGGIYADKENSVNICGGDTPIIITGNSVGEKENNIYFADGATMKINVLPAEGSQIGISMETPGLFATVADGIAPAEVAKFFISDDPVYIVVPTEDGLALSKQQAMPTIGINYPTETLTDFANDGSYTINGNTVTPSADGTIAIQEEWIGTTILIVRKGDGDTVDSNAQNLFIPARPAAPYVTAGIRKINGADTSMEYSSDNGTTWTAFTDETISRISAGTYLVRYCAKADTFASQSASEIRVRNSSGGGGGSPSYYFVTFDTNGGEYMEKLLKVENAKIDLDDYVPEREGYEFVGWYLDKNLTEPVNEIDLKKNITFYAKWEKAEEELIEEIEEEAAFSDVSEYDWYYEAVVYTVGNGLMNGMGDGTFQPNMPLTREMLAVVLYNVEEQPESAGIITFKDVAAGKWYADAIAWASQYRIVAGYSETEFGLGDPITREQFAAILYRYANWKGYDTSRKNDLLAYTDAAEISDYAVEAIKWAAASDIIHGITDTTLVPQGNATRAEAAMMLMNFCENVVK